MKSLRPIVPSMILMMVIFSPSAPAQHGDALRAIYMEFLTGEGYRPSVDEDGDVQFKAEGKTYFMDVHEDDKEFFMIALANIWPIESEEERLKVLLQADQINGEVKGAKIHTRDDNVWITAEMFVEDPKDIKGVFDRSMHAISGALEKFVSRMKE